MKAVTFSSYAGPEQLAVTEVSRPEPGPDELLVRVAAVSLNAFDWHQYRGDPLLVRTREGWRVEAPRVLGADLSGIVEAVGEGVTDYAAGDRVIAEISRGALAEHALVPTTLCAKIADAVDVVSAAAVPMAGLTAIKALRDCAKVQHGESVLVWGASGGVGHLAVQIARILGASRVDAVCSARNAAMVRGVGADEVFDYASSTLPTGPYDVIIDTVSTRSLRQLKPLLSGTGRIATLGGIANGKILGPGRPIIGRMIASALFRVPHEKVFADINAEDLAWLADRLADGSLTPVIQRTYGLDEIRDACRTLEEGHVAGKLIIRVNAD